MNIKVAIDLVVALMMGAVAYVDGSTWIGGFCTCVALVWFQFAVTDWQEAKKSAHPS